MKLICLFLIFVTSTFNLAYSQTPKLEDKITATMVIGFPNITNQQLTNIKAEFLNKTQITNAVLDRKSVV